MLVDIVHVMGHRIARHRPRGLLWTIATDNDPSRPIWLAVVSLRPGAIGQIVALDMRGTDDLVLARVWVSSPLLTTLVGAEDTGKADGYGTHEQRGHDLH
jgi:hypothetical protein